MRDHAHEVAEPVRGRTRSDLDTDRLLALAVVRLLEIIGESAARVPAEERVRRPGAPDVKHPTTGNALYVFELPEGN